MNSTAKKQNRILLVALVVILSAAAILIAVTGSANKKAETTDEPPVETAAETSKPAETAARIIKPDKKDETAAEREKETSDEKSAEKETAKKREDAEAAALQSDILPVFHAPVNGLVLKDYSDEIPVFSYTMDDYRTHTGLDFTCSPGTPVYASADGMICEVTHDPMMGVTVGVQHSGGAVTRYMGLSEESMYLTQPGQNVKAGQVIGASGDTALIESAEENHMHFELTVNGEHKNPADYMKVTYLSDIHED